MITAYLNTILFLPEFNITVFDVLGTLGVVLIVVAYFFLQFQKFKSTDPAYSVINGIGALLVLISLVADFNLPSFIVEIFWLIISIYGLIKSFRAQKKVKKNG